MNERSHRSLQRLGFPVRPPGSLRKRVGTLLAVLLSGVQSAAGADGFALSESVWQRWSTNDGLPQNSIQALHQTAEGYLWIGSREGLVRFDGFEFVSFNDITSAVGGHDLEVLDIDTLSDGTVLIVAPHSVVAFRDGHFRELELPALLQEQRLRAIAPAASGGFYLADQRRIHRVESVSSLRVLWTARTRINSANDILEREEGSLLYATYSGLFQFDDEGQRREKVYSVESGLKSNLVSDLFRDDAGRIWITTVRSRLWGGNLSENRGQTAIQVLVGDRLEDVDFSEDIASAELSCFFIDRQGNRWVGTRHDGLFRFGPPLMRVYTKKDGLSNEHVQAVHVGSDERVWVGTREGLFVGRSDEPFQQVFSEYPIFTGNQNSGVNSVLASSDGRIWVGTEDGIYVGDGLTFARRDSSIHNQAREVYAIIEGPPRDVFAGTSFQLLHFRGTSFQEFGYHVNRPEIMSLGWSPEGKLWAGTREGLYEITHGEWYRPEGLDFNEHTIKGMVRGPRDRMWFATDAGVIVADSGDWRSITSEHGLFYDDIASVQFDCCGNLWLGGERGISRVLGVDLEGFLDGRINEFDCALYRENYGMLSSQVSGKSHSTATQDLAGRFWYATTRGLVCFEPEKVLAADREPEVLIESVRSNGVTVFGEVRRGGTPRSAANSMPEVSYPVASPPAAALRPGGGRLVEIAYTAPSFLAPDGVRFRCRLEGYENEWRTMGQRRLATYTNLKPGSYRFQVIAANNLGLWNRTGASISFEVEPYFYETQGFLWLSAGILGALVLLAHSIRMRFRAQELRLEHQEATARDRARIAKDMHDHMGSSLTQIALLGRLAQQENGANPALSDALPRMVDKAQDVSRSIKELVWATNPQNDTLEGLLSYASQHAQEFLAAAQIRCRLNLPDEYPKDEVSGAARNHLYSIIKEALNNAAKHSQASEVHLNCSISGGNVTIAVEDDGRGITPEALSGVMDGNHNGLNNMRRRAESLGGEFQVVAGKRGGTNVVVTVAVKNLRDGRGEH